MQNWRHLGAIGIIFSQFFGTKIFDRKLVWGGLENVREPWWRKLKEGIENFYFKYGGLILKDYDGNMYKSDSVLSMKLLDCHERKNEMLKFFKIHNRIP